MEVFAEGMVHCAPDGREGGGEFGQDVVEGELLGEDVTTGGFEMIDDDLLVKIDVRSSPAFGAVADERGEETGQYEELIGAMHVNEKPLGAAGFVESLEVIETVKHAGTFARRGFVNLGGQAEVGTYHGDVVGHFDVFNADAFEGVSGGDEEEKSRGKDSGVAVHTNGFKKLGMIEHVADFFRIIAEGGEAFATSFRERERVEDELPVGGCEPIP